MGIFFKFILFLLWMITIGGIVILFRTGFEHDDLNILVLIFFIFAVVNSFLMRGKK